MHCVVIVLSYADHHFHSNCTNNSAISRKCEYHLNIHVICSTVRVNGTQEGAFGVR